ncbi:MAG: prepilin peptidase [Proteobacteria bacterium]|nr:prepilin peptidase [Pseudomonadota bacterium]
MNSYALWEQVLGGPWGTAIAALWGAIWGSFCNVVVVRLPRGESVVRPPSHCRSCHRAVAWYDNLPVLSYLLLRGRCRHCDAGFSPRYALVELGLAGLSIALHRVYFVDASGPPGLRTAQFAITSLFAVAMVAVALIDLATMRIPNAITYPGIPLAVALSPWMSLPHLWDGVIGAAGGYLLVRLIADGWELLTGRQGMGYGDGKQLAMIAGLLGWQALLPTLFLASLQGTLIGVTALLWLRRSARRRRDLAAAKPLATGPLSAATDAVPPDPDAAPTSSPGDDDAAEETRLGAARLPFGPFLSLAALELLLLHDLLPQFFPVF